MDAERRNQILLGVVAVILAGVIYRAWPAATSGEPASSSNERGSATAAPRAAATPAAPDVHLAMLGAERRLPALASGGRNLFRFKPKPAPTPTPTPAPRVVPPPTQLVPAGPPPTPPPPPIVLKFIGIVEASGQAPQRIAVLSDGRNVFHGREGDIIEGRFRILRIGAESIDMTYLDGRGRQTIRLTGG